MTSGSKKWYDILHSRGADGTMRGHPETVCSLKIKGRSANSLQNPNSSINGSTRAVDEKRMVKKFRRAAAGIDEQLPSDLRPPKVLHVRHCAWLFL